MATTVLLAYGPRRTTREAVVRARRFTDRLVVVPAVRPALQGLRTFASPRVHVVEQVGRDGLVDALLLADHGQVLLLHDDVLLSPEGAARLLERAASEERVVVPATNEPGTTGYFGVAAPDVAPELVTSAPDDTAERFRASCMVGSADALLGLVEHRLTAADTTLASVDTHPLLVASVRATHLDACKDVRAEPVGPDGRPLLVAAMIVRDEERFLGDCLEALTPVVDRVELIDTGSVDRTMEIAREHGAVVGEREWRNDFSWARNEALEQCGDAWWVIVVDADERLQVQDVDDLRSWLATNVDEPGAFTIRYRDVLPSGELSGVDQQWRLFPSDGRYRGRLHEMPHHPDGRPYRWSITELAEIRHLGYLPEVIEERKKGDRNLSIARAQWEERGDVHSAYNYARTLRISTISHRLEDESLELYEWIAERIAEGDDGLSPRARSEVLSVLAGARTSDGDVDAAWDLVRRAVEADDDDLTARVNHARLANHRGDFRATVDHVARPRDAMPGAKEVTSAPLELAVELAKAHLGLEDVDAARQVVLEALAETPPTSFTAWLELVSLVAIVAPEEADDLLLDGAVHAVDTTAIEAVARTFHPQDAAEFCTAVALASDVDRSGTAQKAMFALAVAVVADRPELVGALLDRGLVLPVSHLRTMRRHAQQRERAQVVATIDAALQAQRT